MLAIERQKEIASIIRQKGIVYVDELSSHFGVTKETIRRDLEKLEQSEVLSRTYGGAVLKSYGIVGDLPYFERAGINIDLKQQIAFKAVKIIEPRMTLFADCSTTVLEALKALKDLNLTVITNSTPVFSALGKHNFNLISTGGTFNFTSMSLTGATAENMVAKHYTDLAILSCKGISMEHGVTESNQTLVELKKKMAAQSGKVILLVDSDKFDKTALTQLFDFSAVDFLVTNKRPSNDWIEFLKDKNVKIIY